MLYDKRSACVVVFINLDEEEGVSSLYSSNHCFFCFSERTTYKLILFFKDFPEFWPAENSQDYGEFNVELMSDASRVDAESDKSNEDDENADMIERKFKITKVCTLFIYICVLSSYVVFVWPASTFSPSHFSLRALPVPVPLACEHFQSKSLPLFPWLRLHADSSSP